MPAYRSDFILNWKTFSVSCRENIACSKVSACKDRQEYRQEGNKGKSNQRGPPVPGWDIIVTSDKMKAVYPHRHHNKQCCTDTGIIKCTQLAVHHYSMDEDLGHREIGDEDADDMNIEEYYPQDIYRISAAYINYEGAFSV